ncbi:NAF1-domain-containing protein [Thozetella sp. PMI_491]|nr:NAF1-domain-containing protein [Thozetella sp. PMI_491]
MSTAPEGAAPSDHGHVQETESVLLAMAGTNDLVHDETTLNGATGNTKPEDMNSEACSDMTADVKSEETNTAASSAVVADTTGDTMPGDASTGNDNQASNNDGRTDADKASDSSSDSDSDSGHDSHGDNNKETEEVSSSSEDSSSDDDSSEDDSGDEGEAPPIPQHLLEDVDDEGADGMGMSKPPRTKNEIELVPLPIPSVVINPTDEIREIGIVHCITGQWITIRGMGAGLSTPLDIGTVLCLEDRRVIGAVSDLFGPVNFPFYRVGFDPASLIEEFGIFKGLRIFFPARSAVLAPLEAARKHKGRDSSNVHDESDANSEFFSDDELEKVALRSHGPRSRNSTAPSRVRSRARNGSIDSTGYSNHSPHRGRNQNDSRNSSRNPRGSRGGYRGRAGHYEAAQVGGPLPQNNDFASYLDYDEPTDYTPLRRPQLSDAQTRDRVPSARGAATGISHQDWRRDNRRDNQASRNPARGNSRGHKEDRRQRRDRNSPYSRPRQENYSASRHSHDAPQSYGGPPNLALPFPVHPDALQYPGHDGHYTGGQQDRSGPGGYGSNYANDGASGYSHGPRSYVPAPAPAPAHHTAPMNGYPSRDTTFSWAQHAPYVPPAVPATSAAAYGQASAPPVPPAPAFPGMPAFPPPPYSFTPSSRGPAPAVPTQAPAPAPGAAPGPIDNQMLHNILARLGPFIGTTPAALPSTAAPNPHLNYPSSASNGAPGTTQARGPSGHHSSRPDRHDLPPRDPNDPYYRK